MFTVKTNSSNRFRIINTGITGEYKISFDEVWINDAYWICQKNWFDLHKVGNDNVKEVKNWSVHNVLIISTPTNVNSTDLHDKWKVVLYTHHCIRFQHRMLLIATDGFDTSPLWIDYLFINPGETYDVIVIANNTPGNFWIRVESDEVLDAQKAI